MLEFIESGLGGDRWEELCDKFYRLRYQNEGYQKIPASYKGDGGIEGYTKSGIVYQCYCPEGEYTDNELYNHLRDKMTKDIGKFIDPEYSSTLLSIGVRNVKCWHFVIPEYPDKRICQHAETKRQEVMEYKKNHPEQCTYIADDFDIVIKVAADFKPELFRVMRNEYEPKLDFTVIRNKTINWSSCDSDKVNNVKRKLRAVMGISEGEEDEVYSDMVNFYMESYVIGMELMEKLRMEQVEVYESILGLKEAYKRTVYRKTRLNSDSSMNYALFMEIVDDFKKTIGEKLPFITESSVEEVVDDLISGWLADCSMEFKRR